MDSLNYNHLYYFWMVARHGGISPASRELHLTQPTISAQLRQLESALGVPLFFREGKKLVLTAQGQVALDYANRIFGLGQELAQAIQGHDANLRVDLNVGIVDVFPKHLVYQFLTPAITNESTIRMRCYEGKLGPLLTDLTNHRLDVVLSDSRQYHDQSIEVQTHLLGECGLVAMGNASLLSRARGVTLAEQIQSLPILLPTPNTGLRRLLDQWFDQHQLTPSIAGEFEDSGLLKVFALEGVGLCFVPEVLAEFLQKSYRLHLLGRLETGTMRFYALTAKRMFQHPAVLRLSEAARQRLVLTHT
ncbi:MAG: LysR family transcriptional regulator [Planctomycetaceae bacterium]|nr:LysR family transcriptional regulator [Planctomycetaceae bacterium]